MGAARLLARMFKSKQYLEECEVCGVKLGVDSEETVAWVSRRDRLKVQAHWDVVGLRGFRGCFNVS